MQFQNAYFDVNLKVKEMCDIMIKLYGCNPQEINMLFETFNLTYVMKNYTRTLSGGEKQKLNIILSLIHNPDMLIFDELTTGLDSITRKDIYKILIDLKKKQKSIILVTHYFEELNNLCDKVLVIENGNGTLINSKKDELMSDLVEEYYGKDI